MENQMKPEFENFIVEHWPGDEYPCMSDYEKCDAVFRAFVRLVREEQPKHYRSHWRDGQALAYAFNTICQRFGLEEKFEKAGDAK